MRITGGALRSRELFAPRGLSTRPTSDRVREALFNILSAAGVVEGARVLDLYAGTGALGLEALSRRARHATLVESSKGALTALRRNIGALGVQERTRVVAMDVAGFVAGLGHAAADESARFDLVLADPPWALVDTGTVGAVLRALAKSGGLASEATVVLEHAARSAMVEIEGLSIADSRRYGDTALAFYKPAILAAPPRGTKSLSE